MSQDLGGLTVFVAIAETRSFRAAGDRLGITRSAVSQALRRLEDRMGVALLQRTTRSVGLTEAGDRLYAAVRPALAELGAAMEAVGELGARPSGLLRLHVSSIAESFLGGPMLAAFLAACPEVRLDIVVSDDEIDIVAEGFDAGVRLGEVIEQDMVAVPVSAAQRQLVVGAPAYLARRGAPAHPRDLAGHVCIGWRPAPGVAPYRWEFTDEGRDFDVDVRPEVTVNEMGLMIRLALAGAGLTCGMAESFAPHLQRGELLPVLERFCTPFPGFHLYYPSRRNVPPKLRALLDAVRRHRGLSS